MLLELGQMAGRLSEEKQHRKLTDPFARLDLSLIASFRAL